MNILKRSCACQRSFILDSVHHLNVPSDGHNTGMINDRKIEQINLKSSNRLGFTISIQYIFLFLSRSSVKKNAKIGIYRRSNLSARTTVHAVQKYNVPVKYPWLEY